jgi:hypothetical protein
MIPDSAQYWIDVKNYFNTIKDYQHPRMHFMKAKKRTICGEKHNLNRYLTSNINKVTCKGCLSRVTIFHVVHNVRGNKRALLHTNDYTKAKERLDAALQNKLIATLETGIWK